MAIFGVSSGVDWIDFGNKEVPSGYRKSWQKMNDPKLNPKLFDPEVEQVPTRDGYGQGVVALGEKNPNVVVLTGDLSESTRANMFEEKFPERFIECGVAEQNMMGIAAGLA